MKSFTVVVSSRAHWRAVPTLGVTVAAGFGTDLVPGTVLPSMWQRWQP